MSDTALTLVLAAALLHATWNLAAKGVGSSREQAVQAEKWAGIRIAIAASFAPIHARNNVAQGVLMGDHALLSRLQAGESVPFGEFTEGHDKKA